MTICPQPPSLTKVQGCDGIMSLSEPHLTFLKVCFGYSLIVLIGKGYQTDGASVPSEWLRSSKFVDAACKIISKKYPDKNSRETLEYFIGTPFEMPRILAAIVHDALYSCKWKCRILCDFVYRQILKSLDYDEIRLAVEHLGIRLLGGKNWDAVTDLERDRARKIIKVKIVRTKNISKEIAKIRASLEN